MQKSNETTNLYFGVTYYTTPNICKPRINWLFLSFRRHNCGSSINIMIHNIVGYTHIQKHVFHRCVQYGFPKCYGYLYHTGNLTRLTMQGVNLVKPHNNMILFSKLLRSWRKFTENDFPIFPSTLILRQKRFVDSKLNDKNQ